MHGLNRFTTWWTLFGVFLGMAGCAAVPVVPNMSGRGMELQEQTDDEIYSTVLQAHYLSFTGDVERGLSLFNDLLMRFPDRADLHYQFAKFNIDLAYRVRDRQAVARLLDTARMHLEKSVDLDPGNNESRRTLADVCIEQGDFDAALGQLGIMVKENPEDDEAVLALARLLVHVRNPSEAIAILESYIRQDPMTNYEFLKVYALACAELNHLDEAIDAYSRYIDKVPMDFEASYNLALCCFRAGRNDRAEGILRLLVAENMLTQEVVDLLTDVLKAQGRFDDAIAFLSSLTENQRYRVSAIITIGQIYMSLQKFEPAYDTLLRAVSIEPNNRRATFYTALALSELGRFDDALRMLENNLEDRPLSVATVDLTSDILMQIGNIESALKLSGQLMNERPKDARAYIIRADVLERAGRSEETIDVLRSGCDVFPEHPQLHLALAYRLDRRGQWQEAVDVLQALYEDRPDDPEIANYIGYTLADRNVELDRALHLIRVAVDADPENAAYLDSMGWVLFRLGRYEEAFDYLDRALRQYTEDPVVINHMIRILIALDRTDAAREMLRKALESFPNNEDLQDTRKMMEK
ncbi:tetratricopeptide repeat protein [bacterium]|nr:tetratricopeptide repeat protein [candidate division CSSED10-310 bacterium]